MSKSPFNDYDDAGFRINQNGNRTSRVEDEAIIRNVRFKFGEKADFLSDAELVNYYDDFAYTDMFGNNDEQFLDFVHSMREPGY